MKINEVEQVTGIPKKNIRFYEEQGLLTPSRDLRNSYRDYGEQEIRTLRRIKLLRKLNIPIADIRKMQENYLTLDDCLKRQLIALERERKNAESVEQFCRELLARNLTMEGMDVEELLGDMENMEEGGTRFMDVRRRDRRTQKKKALIAACSAIAVVIIPAAVSVIVLLSVTDSLSIISSLAGLAGLVAVPLLVVVGIVAALRERMKEIEGGELDEAVKY